jgi:hypothetical protein
MEYSFKVGPPHARSTQQLFCTRKAKLQNPTHLGRDKNNIGRFPSWPGQVESVLAAASRLIQFN